jgi:hypothetical protein
MSRSKSLSSEFRGDGRSYEANSHSAGHEIPSLWYNPKYITLDYITLDIKNMRRPTKRNICSQSRAILWPSEVLSCVKSERPQNFERQNSYLSLTLEGTFKLKMKLIWTKALQPTAYKDDSVKLRWTVFAQYISLNIKTFKFCHFLREICCRYLEMISYEVCPLLRTRCLGPIALFADLWSTDHSWDVL